MTSTWKRQSMGAAAACASNGRGNNRRWSQEGSVNCADSPP